jgi:hypothetical protein
LDDITPSNTLAWLDSDPKSPKTFPQGMATAIKKVKAFFTPKFLQHHLRLSVLDVLSTPNPKP